MADGQAEMLAFETTTKRDGIINLINASIQSGSSGGSSGKGADQALIDLQQKWRKGEITNFCYLMELNKGTDYISHLCDVVARAMLFWKTTNLS